MIISPPFLPQLNPAKIDSTKPDPMMDAVDQFELAHGIYPITFDRRWHCGAHLSPDMHGPVYAIADGEVVAYRVCQHAIDSGNSNVGFVLLKHTTETGEGRTLTFYSLYMHLLPLAEYHTFGYVGTQLPEFLRMPSGQVPVGQVTPAVSGGGKKVWRKDVLGFLGRYQGPTYLHFEIFMTQPDFAAYFSHTQLGNTSPSTPDGPEWWGHAYFTIPAGSDFFSLPPGTGSDNKLHGIEFKPGQTGQNTLPLHVETYFSQGAKYTNVWSEAADGTRTLLTPHPVPEEGYEYGLYDRATALYPACPSDGYELMRLGRIVSATKTLAADARATWMKVAWASGKQGYIDINPLKITKLSDVDFPFFMGWQKVTDGNTPFGSDGLCDIDVLKKMLKDVSDHESLADLQLTGLHEKEDILLRYVRMTDGVREKLRGFVCLAPSEWDSTHNDTRYMKLLDEGGFYHGNQKGYNDFLKYLNEVQFWDKTRLPAGQKLWFFHPLAFIRHFRKCGWLSENELLSVLPTSALRYAKAADGHKYWTSEKVVVNRNNRLTIQSTHLELNRSMRKFGISPNPWRIAAFLGNTVEETQWFTKLHEDNSGAKYWPWDGRGFLQLTWPDNYVKYWEFLGRVIPEPLKRELSASAKTANKDGSNAALQDSRHPALTAQMIQWREDIASKAVFSAESSGAYWAWTKAAVYADKFPVLQRQAQNITKPRFSSVVYYSCLSYGQVAATVNFGSPQKDASRIARVNGILARYQAYTSALMVLADGTLFPTAECQGWDTPDGYQRRDM
ncbi:hypothetical protein LMG28614_03785 [Paraburkholderia ultramafica]|uniref:Uncharacterized protein n=1 Tax=Paraburkholderia ultramafica TaxID=1544867 RepID=A0A6S7BBK6_9BURK|nr:M23 family metallopeptidase [Paraburkholderia ultramafica]CAB3793885.1 hypothetical protein LMG28614_03785 [Paraburkholderia ultramafica]